VAASWISQGLRVKYRSPSAVGHGWERQISCPLGDVTRFGVTASGYSDSVSATDQQELVRFLEDRFACAQACTECARVWALRASLADLDGPEDQQELRRKSIMCAEVCDATCRVLAEQTWQDEAATRAQVEWCRGVCLETAHVFDRNPGAEEGALACRDCARACTEFLALLR
jgi:hypothetical protein